MLRFEPKGHGDLAGSVHIDVDPNDPPLEWDAEQAHGHRDDTAVQTDLSDARCGVGGAGPVDSPRRPWGGLTDAVRS